MKKTNRSALIFAAIVIAATFATYANDTRSPRYTPGTFLVQSRWGQRAPYNDLCPLYRGVATYTGCNPTAMSQIMFYYRWPLELSENIPSYRTRRLRISVPQIGRENFSYDWENMLTSYGTRTAATDAQKIAVAHLMFHAGAAIQVDYGPVQNMKIIKENDDLNADDDDTDEADVVNEMNGSSGFISNSAIAFARYFDYDNGLRYISRDGRYVRPGDFRGIERGGSLFWSNDSILPSIWDEILRLQIDSLRPVFYSGRSAGSGGHLFVLDGYDNDGNFHVNWGWGRRHDGWYKSTALNPGDDNFSAEQSAIINIMPNLGGKGKGDLKIFGRNLRVSKTQVNHGERFNVNPTIYNIGTATTQRGIKLGVALYTEEGRFRIIGETRLDSTLTFTRAREQRAYTTRQLREDFSLEIPVVIPADVPAGHYVLRTLIQRDSASWEILGTVNDYLNIAAVTVGDAPRAVARTVTFNANGGTVNVTSAQTGNAPYFEKLPVPTREGFAFAGWFTSETSETGDTQIKAGTVINSDMTLYARWKTPVYAIIFNARGGTVSPLFATTNDERSLSSLPIPTRDGYTFIGWFLPRRQGGAEVTTQTKFNANATVQARWTIKDPTFTSEQFTTGVPDNFELHGFSHVETGGRNGSPALTANINKSDSIAHVIIHNVRIGDNGGLSFDWRVTNASSGEPAAENAAVYAVNISTDGGATWTDWNRYPLTSSENFRSVTWTLNNLSNRVGAIRITVLSQSGENVNVYLDNIEVSGYRYIVKFDAAGGTFANASDTSSTTGVNRTLSRLPTPAKDGEVFAGWFMNQAEEVRLTTETVLNSDVTAFAKWQTAAPTSVSEKFASANSQPDWEMNRFEWQASRDIARGTGLVARVSESSGAGVTIPNVILGEETQVSLSWRVENCNNGASAVDGSATRTIDVSTDGGVTWSGWTPAAWTASSGFRTVTYNLKNYANRVATLRITFAGQSNDDVCVWLYSVTIDNKE